jgi:DNA-binding HxlR family transcriptional regulator
MCFHAAMAESSYKQFCPVAKGAEIVATRWTPLILRELMCGERSFNDIHRGVPLMSRALLSERLRQLEDDGIVAKRVRKGGKGHEWRLTRAGDALREVVDMIGRWGLIYGRDRIQPGDYDPGVLMWALRRRVDRDALPARRIVIRFDLSGVPRSRTGLRLYWLVLERDGVDVCARDPGYPVDVTIAGDISALIAVYLGHATWRDVTSRALSVSGDRDPTRHVAAWLRLDKRVGRDLPIVPPVAQARFS